MTELRHTLRFLATHKSFTAATVFTLAIGLGANTALFGLVNLASRPLEIPHPDQLVSIAARTPGDDTGGFQYTFSLESLYDLQRRATSFSHVFGVMPRVGGLSSEGKAAQFFFVAVSDNYFAAIGIDPHLGSLFSQRSGSPAAIVLGHTFWMKHFGGDPSVIGRRVRVNAQPAVVTGVVREGFRGTYLALELDGYVSVEDLAVIDPDVQRWHHGFLFAGGRLRDIGTLAGGRQSAAYAINEGGDIVGFSDGRDGSARAIIVTAGVMRDLNGLIASNSGWVLTHARDINDTGRIVGIGWLNGEQRGFLLTP